MSAIVVHQRWAVLTAAVLGLSTLGAGEPGKGPASFEALGADYSGQVRPLVTKYCLECHSADALEGDLDLERFATVDDVRTATPVWLKVAEMLDNGEMPPKSGRRMPAAERRRLRDWVARYLRAEALANAGDPGPVVLRRLNNAEYTYTLHDLTGVALDPAREFPADGAAGEGFTNTGNALVMSPALLTKYLDAARGVAGHAVLLPHGLRFSASTTRRDWTNEILAEIRTLYRKYTVTGGGSRVNLQGIVFGTNEGGRLPLEKYLAATLEARDVLGRGGDAFDTVAQARGLSPKYLRILWETLRGKEPSPLLDGLRAAWTAPGANGAALAGEVGRWQKALWTFSSVGHIGKVGGPKAWLEPVSPLVARQDLRLKVPQAQPGGEVTLYLVAGDAGDGIAGDVVVWERPRLIAPGQPDLMLRDVRAVAREASHRRARLFAGAAKSLRAAAEAGSAGGAVDVPALARRHDVEPDVLAAWLDYLGVGTTGAAVKIESHLTAKITGASGHDFVNGWGSPDLPSLLANASDEHVRIPGNLKPHGVVVHPSPDRRVAAGWRSPVAGAVRVSARVTHAHPECGNGVTWALELRRGSARLRLAAGTAQGASGVSVGPIDGVTVRAGDLVSLLVGPRDGNHACDLTAIDLTLTGAGGDWDLAREISPDVLAGNPHADSQGRPGVWHFYSEPDRDDGSGSVVPEGSLLARWQASTDPTDRDRLADAVQALLVAGTPAAKDSPDGILYRRLASLRGPLFRAGGPAGASGGETGPGLDPGAFGKLPDDTSVDPASLCVRAPSVVEVRLPADLVEGCEFVTTGMLHPAAGSEGSVQLQLLTSKPAAATGLSPDTPVVTTDAGAARQRFARAFEAHRQVFPPAVCYPKIVPVDEVITLTLFYREDHHLRRLMLDDAEAARLDGLWDELHFVSRDALTEVDAFAQLLEYASQDGDPTAFEPLRGPIQRRAAAFRETLARSEPEHLDAVVAFAARAYRRPLSGQEAEGLRGLYRKVRAAGVDHEEAIRMTLARVLVAPAFLYRIEEAGPGAAAAPVSDHELASRLSYFLWSSQPDDALRELAGAGRLQVPDVLAVQARRMLRDGRVRRLATEFACQWLHVYQFDTLDEKSEWHFPTFLDLRSAMYEEPIRFFTDLFQNDRSVLSAFDADHTFLNEALARHYGIPGVAGPEWRRVDGVKAFGRGGVLGFAATLAKQSGAARTSPILRGTWVSEALLGEKLPKPPKGVPPFPDEEADLGTLSVRQLTERHGRDPACAKCHVRIDPIGFALEDFDAIGRRRTPPPGETHAKLPDGTEFDGAEGLRNYVLNTRRDAVLRQFCRKLLGYALGREVQLSDEPLLDEMRRSLTENGFRFSAAVETIVLSPQFRQVRGRDAAVADVDAGTP